MNPRVILARSVIDPETDAHYAFHSIAGEPADLHTHDFYEFFLVVGGKAVHRINGREQRLEEGSLILIRPRDVHCYAVKAGERCNYINVAFPAEVFQKLMAYLDGCVDAASLTEPELPAHIHLTAADTRRLRGRLEDVNLIPVSRKEIKRAEIRALLAELFTRYLRPGKAAGGDEGPIWLRALVHEMGKRENFVQGLPALLRLSGRSQAYCCRTFRKYRGQSPTEFIQGLRLEYAVNLLLHTDLSVTEIALDAGYDNLSYFNLLFRKRYQMPPRRFRDERKERESVV